MAKNRKTGKFAKGGYKNRKRPEGVSRSGLPKMYPADIDAKLRVTKVS
jgi:hypothetical protein